MTRSNTAATASLTVFEDDSPDQHMRPSPRPSPTQKSQKSQKSQETVPKRTPTSKRPHHNTLEFYRYRLETPDLITQTQLAVLTGYSSPYISLLMSGKRTPSLRALKRIAVALGDKTLDEALAYIDARIAESQAL